MKIGQRNPNKKRKRIPQKSEKRLHEEKIYFALVEELREDCGNRSELSGDMGDWRTDYGVEPHHITKRKGGKGYYNPFNLILITRREHNHIEEHYGWKEKQELLAFIKPRRIVQGYKEEDYQ
ncbi:MAG: hypothetical protein ACFFDI_26450 [Promethearchaeota archaeon]